MHHSTVDGVSGAPAGRALRSGAPTPGVACRCREPHPSSSGDEPGLVDESAKDLGSSYASEVAIGDRGGRFGDHRRAPLIEGSVRPVPVVVIHVLREDDFEMAAARMRSLSRHSPRIVPTNRSAIAFALGARMGVLMILIPSAAKTASKEEVNLVSRSRMRNLAGVVRSVRSKQKLRACWVTQPQTGLALIPAMRTRRVPCSMKNST